MQPSAHHHLHVRKRVYKKLEPFPHPRALVRYFDRAMFMIALVGPLSAFPQVMQVYQTKDVSSLSLTTWVLWLLLSIVWAFYGFLHKETPIVVSQTIYIILNLVVIGGIFIYS